MADTDKTLELLIKLGVIGKEDAQAANDLLKETSGHFHDLGSETKGAGEEAENYEHSSAGMRRVVAELNRAVPGLGEAFHGLRDVMKGGIPELVLVALALEAVKTYWDLYAEGAKKAAEEATAGLEKTRTALHAARDAEEEFNKVQANAADERGKYIKDLADTQKVLEAQLSVKKELLKVEEATESAAAKTSEEREAIRSRYSGLTGSATQSGAGASLDAITNERITIENQIRLLKEQEAAAEKALRVKLASTSSSDYTIGFGETPEQVKRLKQMMNLTDDSPEAIQAAANQTAEKIKNLTEKLKDLNSQADELAHRFKSQSAVGSVEAGGHTVEQLTSLLEKQNGGTQAVIAIVKYHLEHSTSIENEIRVLWNALQTLQRQSANNRNSTTG